MNNRQLIAVLVALGLVAVGVIWKYKGANPSEGTRSAEELSKVLPSFALNEVTVIQLKTAKEEVNLARTGDTWGVKERDGYPANYEFVKDLVTKVFDLKVIDKVEPGQSQLGRLQLISPLSEEAKTAKPEEVGTLLVFKKENDQEIARLLLGKTMPAEASQENPFFNMGGSNGRYVQSGGKNDVAYKVKEAFTSLNVDVKQWVDKQFIAPSGGLKSIEVKVSDPADQSWKVDKEKEGADPVLADKKDGEDIDPEKVKQAGSAFSSAYFSDVATAADKEKSGLDAPKRTGTVTFFDGFTYTIKVGNKVKPEDENSDYYLALNVAYTPVPEPAMPSDAAPPEPAPTPAPAGETDEQKKEREKKDADAHTAWEQAKGTVDAAKTKYETDKKQWEDDKKRKDERLAKEKGFEGRTYVVSKYTVDWFLKDRVYFKKAAAAPATTPAAAPAAASTTVPPVPGSAVFSTPVTAPAPTPGDKPQRIEAVTPPIPVEIAPKKVDPKKPGIIKEAPKPPKVAPPDPTPPLPKPATPEATKPDAAKPEPPKAPDTKPAETPAAGETGEKN